MKWRYHSAILNPWAVLWYSKGNATVSISIIDWDFVDLFLKFLAPTVILFVKLLEPSISALQMFCSSEVTTIRFAAVRTLNQISIDHPYAVSACNQDLESLISDSNRSIATLAITTLLKTGAALLITWVIYDGYASSVES